VRRTITWHQLLAFAATLVVASATASCRPREMTRAARLRAETLAHPFRDLQRLAVSKRSPLPGDWLSGHKERGQSVADFLAQGIARPDSSRRAIGVLPVGDLDSPQQVLVTAVTDYLERFFGVPVHLREALPRDSIPARAGRYRQDLGWSQLRTRYFLEELLPARRDTTTFAMIALTTEDLFPEASWNFVFGQASSSNRTGVWSMHRFGDPSESPYAFRLALARTAKTASHELAHMLGISHCIAYECLMNGSNNLAELDGRPMDLCPACLQKLCWSTGVLPLDRARRLHEFFAAHGLIPEAAAVAKVEKVLESRP
jgi:archaemetzincin